MTELASFLILAILPSFIWLVYFLEKDNEPEPKIRLLSVFLLGCLFAGLAANIQAPLRGFIYSSEVTRVSLFWDYLFAVAFLEELAKLIAVLVGVFMLGVRDLDEPIDFIIYMVTAGLGFAALENYIYFSRASSEIITELAFLRFGITTLFHALVAGITGYFLALAIRKIRLSYLLFGLLLSTLVHAAYNLIISLGASTGSVFHSTLLLAFILGLTLILFKSIKRVKKMKGVCKPEFDFTPK